MIAKTLSRVFMIGRFSSKTPVDPVSHTPINRPPEELASLRTKMIHNGWRVPDATHQVLTIFNKEIQTDSSIKRRGADS